MIECASAMLESTVTPSLVILDEPTSSLDATSTATFYAYLKCRAAEGMSAIITTHRLNEMIDNLPRIYVMRDGRVLGEHDAATATKESLVRAMGLAAHQSEHAVADPGAGDGRRGRHGPSGALRHRGRRHRAAERSGRPRLARDPQR